MTMQMQENSPMLTPVSNHISEQHATSTTNQTDTVDVARATLAPVHAWLNEQTDWVLACIGKLNLLIPQFMVQSLSHIPRDSSLSYLNGLLKTVENTSNSGSTLYIATNPSFQPLDHIPHKRFIATSIASPLGENIHWCWDNVRMLEQHKLPFFELPKRLLTSTTPFHYATQLSTPSDNEAGSNATLAFYANMDVLYHYALQNEAQKASTHSTSGSEARVNNTHSNNQQFTGS